MKKLSSLILVTISFFLSASAMAQDYEKEVSSLSQSISAASTKSGKKKLSVLDFTDLQGHSSELGRFLAEELSVSLVMGSRDFAVLDRANLKNILAEHKLTAEGLVNPENAKKLGQFAGVDAIVMGTITPLKDSLIITIKIVATDTAEIVGAAKGKISATSEIKQLLESGIASDAEQSAAGERDFSAPAAVGTSGCIALEMLSFKVSDEGDVTATVKATNRSKSNGIKLGLFSDRQSQAGALVSDDIGNTLSMEGVEGLSSSTSCYGNDENTFESLRRMASQGSDQLSRELDKDTDIASGQSIVFTLKFRNGSRPAGNVFKFSAALVVAEIIKGSQVKVSLEKVVIPGIRTK